MPMTLQQAAQQALDVQNACNLSGVVHSLDQIVREVLWPEADRLGKGTDFVNTHPIVSMFLDKLASLNRTQCLCSGSMDAYHKATGEVEKLAA
jgi:hypothetical protein